MLTILLTTLLCGVGSAVADTWHSVNDPIDPTYLAEMPFGYRSQWVQPWRAYLDTPPATDLRDGMGINFNVYPSQAQVAARLLAESGITRARYEVSWSPTTYDNPNVFWNASGVATVMHALRDNGLRPLILLNANARLPGPTKSFTATLTADAASGARTVQLDAATAAQVVPGYTGLNDGSVAAGIIFTGVDANGVATLSRPLPRAFPHGAYPASTLRFQPFAPPLLADGSPNPQFERTLAGWLGYVRMTMNLVTKEYGSDNFDVEVWNELGFGSQFLNLGNYYNPLPDPTVKGDGIGTILARTVAFLHDPANGWPDVKVGNGFANQSPRTSGASSVPGLDAIDKHPYRQLVLFPQSSQLGLYPLNALGAPDYKMVNGQITDTFAPTYYAFFPEYYLTGIQYETLIRDIAPITTGTGTSAHGRFTAPPGGTPPAMWVTETNMDPEDINWLPDTLTQSDYDHIHAKSALRTYLSFMGKGVQAVDLFAVNGAPDWNLVDPAFFTAAKHGSSYVYPGTASGGPTMDATRRLAATLTGAQAIVTPRPLSLLAIANDTGASQFTGDGTAAHPSLYDRDVLMVQPFQVDAHRWVAGVYVMTRNVGKVYREDLPATDPTRTDLPPENFRVTIGGVDAAHLTATATDPLSGASVPVDVISRDGDHATLQLQATDSPRMVTLDDADDSVPAPTDTTPVPPPPPATDTTPAPPPPTPTATAPTSRRVSRNKATARIVRSAGAVYLQLRCTTACRVRWSVQLHGAGAAVKGASHSRLLAANRSARIRIATVSKNAARKHTGVVSITIVDPRDHSTIQLRRTIPSGA